VKGHKVRLLVVDIDGTLVNSNGVISAGDKEALKRARELGVHVALSTGRGLQATMGVIAQLSLDSYHISFDGALVSKLASGEEISVRPIQKETVRRMVEVAHNQQVDLELFTVDGYFVERETWSTDAHRDFFGVHHTLVEFDHIWERERVIKGGLVSTSPEERARANRFCLQFGSLLHFSYARTPAFPGADFINILTPGVSKGNALAVLANHLNIPLSQVMAIGDGSNDISLLSTAGLAIAMGNAPDEVKAQADYITLDVDDSGVAAALRKFVSAA
jgi:Cof subfamily protein (haloacid dehalogenase superfamily)